MPPVHQIRGHVSYWRAAMAKPGIVCALALSSIKTGYRLEWDPERGVAEPATLSNHPSTSEHAAFVAAAIAEGVALGTMRKCDRSALRCSLPLHVAQNTAGKLRLIWDGRWVNWFLKKQSSPWRRFTPKGATSFEGNARGGGYLQHLLRVPPHQHLRAHAPAALVAPGRAQRRATTQLELRLLLAIPPCAPRAQGHTRQLHW